MAGANTSICVEGCKDGGQASSVVSLALLLRSLCILPAGRRTEDALHTRRRRRRWPAAKYTTYNVQDRHTMAVNWLLTGSA